MERWGMTELTLIAGLLLGGFSIYLIVSNLLSGEAETKSLSWASGSEPKKSKSGFLELSRPLVHRFGLNLSARVKNPAYRKRIARLLYTSGLDNELNTDEFIGLQLVWGFLFPVILAVLNFSLQLELPWIFVLALGFGGFYFPEMHCKNAKMQRNKQILIDLPFHIDLLALSIEAGMDFIGAIERVSDKSEASPLGQEFKSVLRDIKLGSTRADSLRKMSDRLDMSEINSFVTMIVDADATGGEIGKVLKDQSIQMRVERFARAEKAGARASQLVFIPMMLFILPAIFIMVFGPVVLQFMGMGGK
jgi:tight adherence protein C